MVILRTGLSNGKICALIELPSHHIVSDIVQEVLDAFQRNIYRENFGISVLSREEFIEKHTFTVATSLYGNS